MAFPAARPAAVLPAVVLPVVVLPVAALPVAFLPAVFHLVVFLRAGIPKAEDLDTGTGNWKKVVRKPAGR